MARTIEAYKLRTEIDVDNRKASANLRATEQDVDKLGKRFEKLGPEIDKAMKGHEVGTKFGKAFSSSATALITGSFDQLGTTLGSIIGTAIMPGIGTAIGSTVGGLADTAVSKVSGIVLPLIKQGIELNKQLELTRVEFTTFAGSEREADKYLQQLKQHAIDTGNDFGWVVETSEHIFDLTGNLKLTSTILKAATDQAADFGGRAETIMAVADALGLIAEKGSLASRELQKLYKLGIDAKKYLGDATGLSPKQIERLISQDRIRGDVAARLIAEGVEREKGGFAKKLTDTTVKGQENRFNVLTGTLAAEGTQNVTKGIGDFYRSGNRVLLSDQAKQFTDFLDQTAGSLITLTKSGLETGINVTKGLATGIVSSDGFKAVGSAVTSLGDYTIKQLQDYFVIRSPSQLTNLEIGVPIGEGIAQGVKDGFINSFGTAQEQIVNQLEKLLQDPRVQAFFEAIRMAEGGQVDVMAGGRHVNSGAAHPGEVVPMSQWFRSSKGPSSGAGLFQITRTNWRRLSKQLGLNNFSDPHQQQLAALKLFADRGGLPSLLAGNIPGAMNFAAKDWTSTPGSTIGGGRQLPKSKWLGNYNQALAGMTGGTNGVVPVSVVMWGSQDITGNAAAIFGQTPKDITGAAASIFGGSQDQQKQLETLQDTVPVIVDVTAGIEKLVDTQMNQSARQIRELVNMSAIVPRALTPLIQVEETHANTSIELTKKMQEATRKELVVGISMLTQLSGAISQIGGFMPQETVGKKRGLFSKILGVAAPFLSFIPGVGPILSTVAGIASGALGGNWSQAISGIAGGLAPGGAFRPSGGSSGATWGTFGGSLGYPTMPKRAGGGRGVGGHIYWTGERGPEPYVVPANGQFLSHNDAMRALAGGGDAGLSSAVDRLSAFLARLESMSPHDVVRVGARGYIEAMDKDAELIRLQSRRQRLA